MKVIVPEASCDPLENLLIIAFDENTSTHQRIKIWVRLAEYCYLKRKAIESQRRGRGASPDDDGSFGSCNSRDPGQACRSPQGLKAVVTDRSVTVTGV